MVLLRGFLFATLALLSLALPHHVSTASARDFLSDFLLSEDQEKQLAAQEHPKILEQFGGEYRDPELRHYVESLVAFLGRTSARPDISYRITILNSPVVNAFALPAGYLYVTRGLLALADSEAELAGVLAHEIGHVTARHTARRYSRTVIAQLGIGLLGAVTKGTQLEGMGGLLEPGAVLALQSFSREHEHEADLLGVETMSRAGFDPYAMARFLAKLERKTNLDARGAGRSGGGGQADLFATHPRTADRVQRTVAQAAGTAVRDPITAGDIYLEKIDGLLYGDDPAQGFVRGRRFAHPDLDFQFEVPEGFTIVNGQTEVVARGPRNAAIRFDMEAKPQQHGPRRYISEVWAAGQKLSDLERISIGGRSAATAALALPQQGGGQTTLRLVAIQAEQNRFYRFLLAAPGGVSDDLWRGFHETVHSFRSLTRQDRSALRPYRLVTHRVRRGETVASLAETLPFANDRIERFRVMNGLAGGEALRAGQIVKLVTTDN